MNLDDIKAIIYNTFFTAHSRFYWLYLLAYLGVAVCLLKYGREKVRGLKSVVARLLPREIYLHPSFAMDIKVHFLFQLCWQLGMYAGVLVAATTFSENVVAFLAPMIETSSPDSPGIGLVDRIIFTFVLILVFDLAYFLLHYAAHKVPLFWAFHQFHHAAEHLTPLTSSRFHPVEMAATMFVATVVTTVCVSAFSLYHGSGVQLITVHNVSVVFFGFYLLANFRHSHMWISYGQGLSRVLVSPCMHRVHHSTEQRHIDRNFGLIFSVWDGLFRSRYVPDGYEPFEVGVKHTNLDSSRGLIYNLWIPIRDAWRVISAKLTANKDDMR